MAPGILDSNLSRHNRDMVNLRICRFYIASESLLFRHGTNVTPIKGFDLPRFLDLFFAPLKVDR